jgi:hypothetical protein
MRPARSTLLNRLAESVIQLTCMLRDDLCQFSQVIKSKTGVIQ